jgi:hypothetical protein
MNNGRWFDLGASVALYSAGPVGLVFHQTVAKWSDRNDD